MGGMGIGLLVGGLVAGGGVYAWQRIEANQSAGKVTEIRGIIENIDDYEGDTLELVRRFNNAESARANHELIANIALGVGSGLAALGAALLLIDLMSDTPTDPDISYCPRIMLGPGFASVQLQF